MLLLTGSMTPTGPSEMNLQSHVHLPATLFLFLCILHSIKQWTDFPQRNFIPKAELSQANGLFPVSICVFTFLLRALSRTVLINLLCYPICFPFIIAALLLLRLAILRILAHVSSPYLYHTQPSLSSLVLHGWSHGGFL